MTFYKKLTGYAAQARWFQANLEGPDGQWVAAGWTKLGNGAVKPVFTMPATGTPVVVLDGLGLQRTVSEVPAGHVFATEDAARAAAGGW